MSDQKYDESKITDEFLVRLCEAHLKHARLSNRIKGLKSIMEDMERERSNIFIPLNLNDPYGGDFLVNESSKQILRHFIVRLPEHFSKDLATQGVDLWGEHQ